MDDQDTGLRTCPYCKEEIKADAVKCKYCRSTIRPERPSHGGTCPYCKEEIHPEAVKCKHCGSRLDASSECGSRLDASSECGCSEKAGGMEKAGMLAALGAAPLDLAGDVGFFTGVGGSPVLLPAQCGDCESVGGFAGLHGVGRKACSRRMWRWNPATERYELTTMSWFEPCTPEPVAAQF
jgi:hypothetical protein